jgi:hypothetical protein
MNTAQDFSGGELSGRHIVLGLTGGRFRRADIDGWIATQSRKAEEVN